MELRAGDVEFAGHMMQLSDEVAASISEYVPDVQSIQALSPVVGLYVPAEQDLQVAFLNVYPALQEQETLPLGL